jgi:hypothetical protein
MMSTPSGKLAPPSSGADLMKSPRARATRQETRRQARATVCMLSLQEQLQKHAARAIKETEQKNRRKYVFSGILSF